jgi:hypothetical protein
VSRDPGEPRSAERASIARLLEASRDALADQRIIGDRLNLLAGYLIATLDTAALAIRQGYRAHVLDRLVADLDRHRELLAERGGEPR